MIDFQLIPFENLNENVEPDNENYIQRPTVPETYLFDTKVHRAEIALQSVTMQYNFPPALTYPHWHQFVEAIVCGIQDETVSFTVTCGMRGSEDTWPSQGCQGNILLIVDRDPTLVRLKACNGKFLSAVGGGGGTVVADKQFAHKWETFELQGRLEYMADIKLKAFDGVHFLQAEDGGGAGLNANAGWAKEWETFKLVFPQDIRIGGKRFQSGAQIGLQCSNGHYVSVADDGSISAKASSVGPRETFILNMVNSSRDINLLPPFNKQE